MISRSVIAAASAWSRAKAWRSQAKGGRLQQSEERRRGVRRCERGALRLPFGRVAPPAWRAQIEEAPAADRALRRDVANDEAILRRRGDRLVEHQLHVGGAARRDRRAVQQDDARADFGRGVMQPNREPLADRLRLARQHAQPRVDPLGGRMQRGIEHDVAAMDRVLGNRLPRKIEGAAVARAADLGRACSGRAASARAPSGRTG